MFVTIAMGACSFVVNTDPYKAGCGGGTKECPLDTGEMSCVSTTLPDFGCSRAGCVPCGSQHVASATCNNDGTCGIALCVSGYQDCNNNTDDGCETNLSNNTNHCGQCGTDCEKVRVNSAAPHVVSAKCVSALCKPNQCEPGWMDCDGALSNGCEQQSAACGKCCPAGQTCNQATGMCG
jgi:hypothetical protein